MAAERHCASVPASHPVGGGASGAAGSASLSKLRLQLAGPSLAGWSRRLFGGGGGAPRPSASGRTLNLDGRASAEDWKGERGRHSRSFSVHVGPPAGWWPPAPLPNAKASRGCAHFSLSPLEECLATGQLDESMRAPAYTVDRPAVRDVRSACLAAALATPMGSARLAPHRPMLLVLVCRSLGPAWGRTKGRGRRLGRSM